MAEFAACVWRKMLDTYYAQRKIWPRLQWLEDRVFIILKSWGNGVVGTVVYGGEAWAARPSSLCNVTRLKNRVYTLQHASKMRLRMRIGI